MTKTETVHAAADKLEENQQTYQVLAGFDGFVDQIIHLVGERENVERYQRIEEMTDLAEMIHDASGKSANIEMVPIETKLGGNGPNMGQAFLEFGVDVHYIGALGRKRIHPVFQSFSERCERVVSLSDPGVTEALEFNDGKLMLGKLQPLKMVTWDRLLRELPEEEFASLLEQIDLVACLNWTMIPYMNEILDGLVSLLSGLESETRLFIDLCDPRKRTLEDKENVLSLIQDLQDVSSVILGLNEEESRQVAEVVGLDTTDDHEERAVRLREELGLTRTVVHPVKTAHVATPNDQVSVSGPYTEEPRLTTGAGDNFNAGYCLAELMGMTPEQALYTGVCASGYYVRNAHPPTRSQLVDFMKRWSESA